MKNNLPAFLAMALLSTSCSSRVQTLTLSHPNPTSYSFPHPAQQVHDSAMKALSTEHQYRNPIFGKQPSGFRSNLTLETSSESVYSEGIFRDALNAQDLYLHSFYDPIVRSAVYRGKDEGLPFIAAFHVHLKPVGADATMVSVTALNTEVIAGKHFGIGPCGPGMANTYKRVEPTTVEEYTVLRYLGSFMGVTNMPALILPDSN